MAHVTCDNEEGAVQRHRQEQQSDVNIITLAFIFENYLPRNDHPSFRVRALFFPSLSQTPPQATKFRRHKCLGLTAHFAAASLSPLLCLTLGGCSSSSLRSSSPRSPSPPSRTTHCLTSSRIRPGAAAPPTSAASPSPPRPPPSLRWCCWPSRRR